MAAYCLFDNVEVNDPAKLEQYAAGVLPIVERYGGRYVLMGGKCEVVAGQWRPTYPVMIEFPSLEQAKSWYHSPDYTPLIKMRQKASRGRLMVVEGV